MKGETELNMMSASKAMVNGLALVLISMLMFQACDEDETARLNGTWELTRSERKICSNASLNHGFMGCLQSQINSCRIVFTDSTWTTEADTTLRIAIVYEDKTHNNVFSGRIYEAMMTDCTISTHTGESPCETRFILAGNTLSLISTGKTGTREEGCLVTQELLRIK